MITFLKLFRHKTLNRKTVNIMTTTHIYYEIWHPKSGSYDQHRFKTPQEAIDHAQKKISLPDKKNEDYWNGQDNVVHKVTVITEVIKTVTLAEKV